MDEHLDDDSRNKYREWIGIDLDYVGDDEYDRSDINMETDIPNDDQNVLRCTKSSFHGIKIFDHINPNQMHPYFKVKINGKIKYLHKQSACYLITSNTPKLSNDRLSRVRQQAANR